MWADLGLNSNKLQRTRHVHVSIHAACTERECAFLRRAVSGGVACLGSVVIVPHSHGMLVVFQSMFFLQETTLQALWYTTLSLSLSVCVCVCVC